MDGSVPTAAGSPGWRTTTKTGACKFKDHTFSSVVTFDAEWRRNGGWLFPQSTIDRMAAECGLGRRDRPRWLALSFGPRSSEDVHAFGRPPMGPTLIHIATIDLEVEGQAFSWAKDKTWTVFAIDRRKSLVRTIEIPPVTPADAAIALAFPIAVATPRRLPASCDSHPLQIRLRRSRLARPKRLMTRLSSTVPS